MKVYNNRDYDVYHTETKYENNSYNIFYNPNTSPPFNSKNIANDIYDAAGVNLNIHSARIITVNDPTFHQLQPEVDPLATFSEKIDVLMRFYTDRGLSKQSNNEHYVELISVPCFRFGTIINTNYFGQDIPYSTVSDQGALAFVCSWLTDQKFPGTNNTALTNQIKSRAVVAAHELGHAMDYHPSADGSLIWLSDHDNGHNGKFMQSCVMRSGNSLPNQIESLSFCEAEQQKLMNINWSPEGKGKKVITSKNNLSRSTK